MVRSPLWRLLPAFGDFDWSSVKLMLHLVCNEQQFVLKTIAF
jgi:hypothetical protein